jgi:membrane protein
MRRLLREAACLIKDAALGWNAHHAMRLGAALAYYTIFSIGPLLLIAIAIAGLVFGPEAANQQIVATLSQHIGSSAATAIEVAIDNAHRGGGGRFATLIGFAVLLFAAGVLFAQLQSAFNEIFGAPARPRRAVWSWIKKRLLSFALVLATGLFLLLSLLATATLAAVGRWLATSFDGRLALLQRLDFVLAFALMSTLFALLFKVLPDVALGWRDVWPGALVTAALFALGKLVLSLYVARAGVGSSHGAAGSMIVLMVWVYYSSQILFFGAELTRAWAARRRHVACSSTRHEEARPT